MKKCNINSAKRIFTFIFILFFASGLTGCEAVRKKFTRKKKPTVKAPRFYQVKKYEKKPTPELYQKHYAYWAGWQSEILQQLGQNHKKDSLCIEQIVSNLEDMQNILVPEKGRELQKHIDRLIKVKDIINKEELTQFNKNYAQTTLEREDRTIKREFDFNKVKNFLKKSFEEDNENPS